MYVEGGWAMCVCEGGLDSVCVCVKGGGGRTVCVCVCVCVEGDWSVCM